jgi:hypothetical protein
LRCELKEPAESSQTLVKEPIEAPLSISKIWALKVIKAANAAFFDGAQEGTRSRAATPVLLASKTFRVLLREPIGALFWALKVIKAANAAFF